MVPGCPNDRECLITVSSDSCWDPCRAAEDDSIGLVVSWRRVHDGTMAREARGLSSVGAGIGRSQSQRAALEHLGAWRVRARRARETLTFLPLPEVVQAQVVLCLEQRRAACGECLKRA